MGTNVILIIALAFGLGLGAALIGFSVKNRKNLPRGMKMAFIAVGFSSIMSAVIMGAGLLLR